MPADYNYSRSNTYQLQLPIQLQLTGKLQTFSPFFIAFLESALNFEDFAKKSEPKGSRISEVINSDRHLYLRAKRSSF